MSRRILSISMKTEEIRSVEKKEARAKTERKDWGVASMRVRFFRAW